jgi:hypothetical protein
MVFVAVVALNLGAVRALYDDIGEHLLFDALRLAFQGSVARVGRIDRSRLGTGVIAATAQRDRT